MTFMIHFGIKPMQTNTQNISEESPEWYAQTAGNILTEDIKLELKKEVEQELFEEYNSVLNKANWFQTIGLNFKLQRLKQRRTQLAFQNYLESHSYPQASDESLW